MSKRSSEKRITRKALIIRYLRHSRRISLNQAGRLTGVTGPAIAHMEAGRMDISEERLEAIVRGYGYTMEDYHRFADGRPVPVSYLDECIAMVRTLDEAKLQAVHAILLNLTPRPVVEQKAQGRGVSLVRA